MSDNLKGCLGWLLVMTLATIGGFAIGYISTHWF
jgi:hypothetical protein